MTARPPTALWGIDAPLVPLPGGHRNVAFRTQGLASEVVFKSTRRSEMALRWLDEVFDHAEASGLAVPRPRQSINGQFCEHGWTMELFLPGRPARRHELVLLAAPMRKLHETTSGFTQRPGFAGATDLAAIDGPDMGGDIDLTAMPPPLVEACRRAWCALAEEPRGAVHGDLNPSNVLIDADGRVALVDWDEARMDAVVFDLAQVDPNKKLTRHAHRALDAWEIASSWQTEPDYARRLAYQFMEAAK